LESQVFSRGFNKIKIKSRSTRQDKGMCRA
jgi:hypothetical protein